MTTQRSPKVTIETREYERSHGKAPRGRGLWVFDVEYDHRAGTERMRTFASGSYGDACAQVRRESRAHAQAHQPNTTRIYIYTQP